MPKTTTHQRPFPDILNEWTDTLIAMNRVAKEPEAIGLITRLGTLGQRLIFEANKAGMMDTLRLAKESISGKQS